MNVLAVRQDNNGDVLLAGPALRALGSRGARVSLVCGPSGHAAARTLPGVAHVVVFEAGWIEANPQPVERAVCDAFVDEIRDLDIDEAIIFTSFHQSALPMALLLRMAGIRRVVAHSEDYPGALLDLRHRVDDDLHEVERGLSLARAAGYDLLPHDDGRLRMLVGTRNPIAAHAPYIVVHPGATVPARAWPAARNRELVDALVARGTTVVVTGSADERALCASVAGNHAIDLCGTTDFVTLARVIADAAAIVVGNTGAAHVAAAVGTPTVSLFAPTIPAERFRPWMVEHVLLGNQHISCRGCRARVCPREGHPCLSLISPREVLAALDALVHPRTLTG